MRRNRCLTSLSSVVIPLTLFLNGCAQQHSIDGICHRLFLSVRQSAASPQNKCKERSSAFLLQFKVDAKIGWDREAKAFPTIDERFPKPYLSLPQEPKGRLIPNSN